MFSKEIEECLEAGQNAHFYYLAIQASKRQGKDKTEFGKFFHLQCTYAYWKYRALICTENANTKINNLLINGLEAKQCPLKDLSKLTESTMMQEMRLRASWS